MSSAREGGARTSLVATREGVRASNSRLLWPEDGRSRVVGLGFAAGIVGHGGGQVGSRRRVWLGADDEAEWLKEGEGQTSYIG